MIPLSNHNWLSRNGNFCRPNLQDVLKFFALMWSSPDVVGLFSNNVVSFSRNVVLRDHLFSVNLVSKPRMLSVRTVYVLGSLQLVQPFYNRFWGRP